MCTQNLLHDTFNIPKSCILEHKRNSTVVCLVPEVWVQHLQNGKFRRIQPIWYEKYLSVGALLLAPSNSKIPKPWKRVLIQVFPKSDETVYSLVDDILCYGKGKRTFGEDMVAAKKDYWHNIEKEALKKYKNAFILPEKKSDGILKSQTQLLRLVLCEIFKTSIQDMDNEEVIYSCCNTEQCIHPNIVPAYGILESNDSFFVVQPYSTNSLHSLLSFSPTIMLKSNAKSLFIIYQLLHAIKYCHEHGLAVGDVRLQHISIDEMLWMRILQPSVDKLFTQISTRDNMPVSLVDNSYKDLTTIWNHVVDTYAKENLSTVTTKWMFGTVSNFEYLLLLNYLAGRRIGDPNHHPVIPWVMDFTSEYSNYRDLTKSKYRINKGDAQLDQTYALAATSLPVLIQNAQNVHIPHHISDVLSDITYYVYKARRTPQTVLCNHVRSNWVPHEYPATVERLQAWTPDECIPEFFTDPDIFISLHSDLADLAIPTWAKSNADFVKIHMEVLEGEYVSQNLHNWIDLTFGSKLSGQAAILAKNVCLQLVDNHTQLCNHGVVQLFTTPHPQKLSDSDSCLASTLMLQPQQGMIHVESEPDINKKEKRMKGIKSQADKGTEGILHLPENYNPLLMLDRIESLLTFSLQQSKSLPTFLNNEDDNNGIHNPKMSLLDGDMQALGCCIVEIILPSKTRTVNENSTFQSRFELCRRVCKNNWRDIPRVFHEVLHILFQLDESSNLHLEKDQYGALFHYNCDSNKKLPPPNVDILLQPNFQIINFPNFFPSLYEMLCKYHKLNAEIVKLQSQMHVNGVEIPGKLAELGREKVAVFSKCISRLTGHLGQEGADLIVPFVQELFSDPLCSVHAVWSLFSTITLLLGPKRTQDSILSHIVQVFNDENTSPKHIKLYHRSFIVQLKVRLGLETFLNTFSTLLVEASAGYKDFVNDGQIDDRQNSDVLGETINIHDGFEVPSDGVVFTLGTTDESDIREDISMASRNETSGAGEDLKEDVEEMEGDILLHREPDNHQNGNKYTDEDAESVISIPNETTESIGSIETSHENSSMAQSLGRVSVHSVSRFIDTDTPSESESEKERPTNSLNQGRKSLTSSTGSVHEAVEATDDSVLNSITDIEQKVTRTSHNQPEYNLRDVASETIKWLSHLLGPVLTAKYFSRNLLRMLSLCYTGTEQLQEVVDHPQQSEGKTASTCKKVVAGDLHAKEVLECLSCIAIIYGEHVILLQYFSHVKLLIYSAMQKLSSRSEAGLIGCLSLLFHIIPYLSDKTLLDVVEDTIFGDIISPILNIVSSVSVCFPSGSQARRVLCYKTIDILYVISRRIGFELTRQHMTSVIQTFFSSFDSIVDKQFVYPNSAENMDNTETQGFKRDASGENLYYMVMTKSDEFRINNASGAGVESDWTPQHRRQGSAGSKRSLSPPNMTHTESPGDSPDSSEQKSVEIQQQLKDTFTPEMAHIAYIPFCRLAGSIYMEQKLLNDDLIRHLCALHDQSLTQQLQPNTKGVVETDNVDSIGEINSSKHPDIQREDNSEDTGGFGVNMGMVGNKLTIHSSESSACSSNSGGDTSRRKSSEEDTIDVTVLKSPDMEVHHQRHLHDNWLAYWEHEVGLSNIEDPFSFKQIRLMTFGGAGSTGHNSSVRSIYVLDNENSFLSASKDKTVKLWSLRSFGDGTGRAGCQWTYTSHKKSVFTVTMLESLRYAASCDGSVHVWDPFMGACVRTYESAKGPSISVLNAMPAPSTCLLTASESLLRLLDVRSSSHVYDFKCTTTPVGIIRCVTVSRDGNYVAVGYTSGVVSVLDIRTGLLLASWKAHEGEILQIKSFHNQNFITSSFDQSMSLWTFEDPKLSTSLKGITEPVHCFDFYKNSLISVTTANRIGVHSSVHTKGMFTSIKLKTDVFRGVVTTMAVLPLNKLLVLGSDNGQIRLLA